MTNLSEHLQHTSLTLVSVSLTASEQSITLRGTNDAGTDNVITLSGVRESRVVLPLPERVEISLQANHPLLWEYGPKSSIFGNAALPDPPRFFLDYYQAVTAQLQVPRDPAEYLNWQESLTEWLGFVYSRSYCLLSAPDPVVAVAKSLLDAQAAEYIALPDPPSTDGQENSGLHVVVIGTSWIVCEKSTVSLQ